MTKEYEGRALIPMIMPAVALLVTLLIKLDVLVGLAGKQPQLELLVIISFTGTLFMALSTLTLWCLDFWRQRDRIGDGITLSAHNIAWTHVGAVAGLLGFQVALCITSLCCKFDIESHIFQAVCATNGMAYYLYLSTPPIATPYRSLTEKIRSSIGIELICIALPVFTLGFPAFLLR